MAKRGRAGCVEVETDDGNGSDGRYPRSMRDAGSGFGSLEERLGTQLDDIAILFEKFANLYAWGIRLVLSA